MTFIDRLSRGVSDLTAGMFCRVVPPLPKPTPMLPDWESSPPERIPLGMAVTDKCRRLGFLASADWPLGMPVPKPWRPALSQEERAELDRKIGL